MNTATNSGEKFYQLQAKSHAWLFPKNYQQG